MVNETDHAESIGEEVTCESTPGEMTTIAVDYDVLGEIRVRAAELSRDAGQRVSYNEYLRYELLENDDGQ
jgi:hypothetical protein